MPYHIYTLTHRTTPDKVPSLTHTLPSISATTQEVWRPDCRLLESHLCLMAETQAQLRRPDVPEDGVLVAQGRAYIGHVISHAGATEMTTH